MNDPLRESQDLTKSLLVLLKKKRVTVPVPRRRHPLRAYAFICAMMVLGVILTLSLCAHVRMDAQDSVVVDLCAIGCFLLSLFCGLPRE
jgi:hypothetical protein